MENPVGDPTDGARRRGDILQILRENPQDADGIWAELRRRGWKKLHQRTVQNDLTELFHHGRIRTKRGIVELKKQ